MLARIGIRIIRLYQRLISPLLPPACRFVPSCSDYAIEALRLHGFWRGGSLAAWRLLRCNPFAKGGYDPVPGPDLKSTRLANTDSATARK